YPSFFCDTHLPTTDCNLYALVIYCALLVHAGGVVGKLNDLVDAKTGVETTLEGDALSAAKKNKEGKRKRVANRDINNQPQRNNTEDAGLFRPHAPSNDETSTAASLLLSLSEKRA
ncbi:MAG: hypothetical protein COB66_06545, partial [Coxiella sp. (in: Bacteria)]